VTGGLVANGARAMVARQCVALKMAETLVARERSVRETHTAKVMASKTHAAKVVASESHSAKAHPAKMSVPATPKAATKVPAARLYGVRPQTKRAETDND